LARGKIVVGGLSFFRQTSPQLSAALPFSGFCAHGRISFLPEKGKRADNCFPSCPKKASLPTVVFPPA
jgi:hypothetical protein